MLEHARHPPRRPGTRRTGAQGAQGFLLGGPSTAPLTVPANITVETGELAGSLRL